MHNQQCNIPAFLNKLTSLVDDPNTDNLIYWDSSGRSFHIRDGNRLAKDVLPMFFKHNNLSSFIRQLNMYGFRKINRADSVIGFASDNEDMEFSHPYFQRNNVNLLSKIHRKPPSYNFAANFLNNNLSFNTPVSINSLCDQIAANGGNRIVLGTEFNRLSEAVRQMRSRQESTTQQMHILRAENQFMYRQISQLRNQLEQQGQLIQTLFNFLSAIASDRRNSGIRIGSGKRKLALTGAPAADGIPPCVEYNLDPAMIPEKARLVPSNSQIKRVLFSQPQTAMAATSGSSEVVPRCNSSPVEVLSSSSNTTVLSQSAPILAIQDVTPVRKRSRSASVNQKLLPETAFMSSPPDVLSFNPDLLDTMASGASTDASEDVITSKPFEEGIEGFDDGFVQSCKLPPSDCHLSDIEPSISSPIANLPSTFIQDHDQPLSERERKIISGGKLTVKHGKKPRSAAVSKIMSPVRRFTAPGPGKNSSSLSKSPMLANVGREENVTSPYIPDGEDLLSSNSPAQKGFKIAELTGVEGDFPWDSETDQPADASLMNDIVSLDRQDGGDRGVSENGDRNMDDVVTNFMLSPSLGQSDQNDLFDNFFAISPLKSLTSSLASPDCDINDIVSDP
ncbi:unnamed protein product [Hydatigera taeniaeformis]|uniref:HSF_DOMAIN domain-containing protein n=1 Tax=Hydatigena taeniaeformis TaxID=6205 RepID=A0A0R3WZS8_HYDTA|nr:unnamed protein product [Hydatigera taeniaeformis]